MKKIILIAGLTFLLLNSNAQKKKQFGVRAGYLASYMTLNGEMLGHANDNYFVTIYRDTNIFPFLHFQSGLEYTKMGGSFNNHSHYINYLGVPLGLKAKVGPIYALGGASFNIKLSENTSFPNTPFMGTSKWYDTNAFIGAGLEILIFTFDVKYIHGLTDINNGLKNNGYQIGLGLRF